MKNCIVLLIAASAMWANQPLRLTLNDAEQLAVHNHPSLSAQRYVVGAAREVTKEVKANFGPQLSANFTAVGADDGSRIAAGGLNNPVIYNRLGSGLSVSQMVYDFGRTGNQVAAARLHADAQEKDFDLTKADVLLETDRAYFDVLRSQALLNVAEQTVKARQLVVDQISALAESKLRSQLDVSFAKVNLADAQMLLAQAQNDIKSARARLASAMGLPGETNFTVEESGAPDPLPDRPIDLVREALRSRPDAQAYRLEENAAEKNAKAERALLFPSVAIVAGAGFVPAGTPAVPGQYGAIGLNVNVPVFNGGLYSARRNEAELRARAAGEDVKVVENRITRDVQLAYNNAQTAYERIHLADQMLAQAKLALDLSQSRYDLGLTSMIELSQAQLNLTNAQIASARAKYDYQSQRRLLDYQIGALR